MASLTDKLALIRKDFASLIPVNLNQLLDALFPILERQKLLLTQPMRDGYVYTDLIDLESKEKLSSSLRLPEPFNSAHITAFRFHTLQGLLALKVPNPEAQPPAPAPKPSTAPPPKEEPKKSPAAKPAAARSFKPMTSLDEEADFEIPFGKFKGKLASKVPVKSLQWLGNAIQESILDPEKSRFKRKNQEMLEKVEFILGQRGEE